MTETTKLVLLLIFIGLTAVLAIIALRLWKGIRTQQTNENQEKSQVESEKRDRLTKSVGLIAQTTIRGELNISEAALRTKTLLDHLIPEEQARKKYQAIYALHDATEHFARREARDALSPRDRQRQDYEREKIEAEYHEPVMASFRSILEHGFRH